MAHFENLSFCSRGFLLMLYNHSQLLFSEAVTQRCYVKKMFLEILQNSLENTCASLFFFNKAAGSDLQLRF